LDYKDFRYCPRCGAEELEIIDDKCLHCSACDFTFFQNVAASTAIIIETKAGVLFERRVKEPEKGRLDLPGGFVDMGEGTLEGARRECLEEIGIDLADLPGTTGGAELNFLTSYGNSYLYKDILYYSSDDVFYIKALDLCAEDLHFQTDEVAEVLFIKPDKLPEEIARGGIFSNNVYALEYFLKKYYSK
jgi:8-oxo-dGTP pyrophosphatase MutT (NUDIX family)